MDYAFLVAGSNCCGKTTLVKRVLDRLTADGFDDRHIFNARADSGSYYKGKTSDQEQKLLEVWQSKATVAIFEGTRINSPLIRVAKAHPENRKLEVLIVLQKPDVMKAHMMARCARKNKTFRADYWSMWKLEYEGMKRYPTYFRKRCIPTQSFTMDLEYQVAAEIEAHLEARIREVLEGAAS